jgi:hypothetical protein
MQCKFCGYLICEHLAVPSVPTNIYGRAESQPVTESEYQQILAIHGVYFKPSFWDKVKNLITQIAHSRV